MEIFKAQVVSQSSTSIQNQLAIPRDDVRQLRTLFIQKTTSLQHSQTLAADDLADKINQLNALSTRIYDLEQGADIQQLVSDARYKNINKYVKDWRRTLCMFI